MRWIGSTYRERFDGTKNLEGASRRCFFFFFGGGVYTGFFSDNEYTKYATNIPIMQVVVEMIGITTV